jgi:RIO kinase 1
MQKSGKKATAYRCAAEPATGQAFYVAKVYRDQESRGFKNDAVYRAGQYIRDSHLRRALANKSRVGREFQFSSWVGAEYATHRLLHDAGAIVPRPVDQAANAILMEYVGDEEGPAPPLQRVDLEPPEVRPLRSAGKRGGDGRPVVGTLSAGRTVRMLGTLHRNAGG